MITIDDLDMYVVGEGNKNGELNSIEHSIGVIRLGAKSFFQQSYGIMMFSALTVAELANIAIILPIMDFWSCYQAGF